MKNLSIKQVPYLDRPYEKLEKYGASYLSDSELLAIIIKSGTKEMNCLEISKYILTKKENGLEGFSYLEHVSLEQLKTFKGIGKVKAIQIKAVIEIARRIVQKNKEPRKKVVTPKDIFECVNKEFNNKQVESVKLVLLNRQNEVKSIVNISTGSVNKAAVSIKELLSEPIKQLASSIVLVHNHPSFNTNPSREDINITRKVFDYAKMFDIELLDHIVIGDDNYTSIREFNNDIFDNRRLN